jgi:hypothetical protein
LELKRSLPPRAKWLKTIIAFANGAGAESDNIWGETLPLDFIFGTPRKQAIKGFQVYTVSFNLSS